MSIKGFPTQDKSYSPVDGLSRENTDPTVEHVTMTQIGDNKHAVDISLKGFYEVGTDAAEALSTTRTIVATSHSAVKGDIVRFTAGTLSGIERSVRYVSTDLIVLDGVYSVAPTALDAFTILRGISQQLDSTGATISTAGPLQYTLDSASELVEESTGTPANNSGLPVRILDTTGEVDVRTLMDTTNTNTGNIDAKLGTLGQKASAGSAPVVLSTEQEALLQSISDNSRLDVVDFLDSGIIDASSTAITTAGLTVVASLAADVKEIEVNDDIGDYMALTDGSDVVLCYLSNVAGGRRKVQIASGTALKIRSLTGVSITVGQMTINFLG